MYHEQRWDIAVTVLDLFVIESTQAPLNEHQHNTGESHSPQIRSYKDHVLDVTPAKME